jgi:replicative DNA helicase
MGKSSMAVSIAQYAAVAEQVPVVIFSLEMSKMELVQRLMCAEARVDSNRLRRGNLQDSDWPKLSHALGRLAEAPIYIDDTANVTIMEMRAKCRRLKAKHGLGLVIVDYLQLMQPLKRSDNRVQEVADISRSLKILARELELPVIAVSQLSRNLEHRTDKRPVLADLRDSGALEQDADLVVFIYRDEVYNSDTDQKGIAEIHVAKHRNGPTGKIDLAFLDHYTKFANLARGA